MSNIAASPNWYCSQVSDSNEHGLFVYGGQSRIHCFHWTPAEDNNDSSCQQSQGLEFIACLVGHAEKVTCVAVGQTTEQYLQCCSASEDKQVKLWDISTGTVLQEHSHHKDKITAISWSQASTDLIVSGDEKGCVVTWKLKQGEKIFTLEKGHIFSVACAPHDAQLIAVGYKNGLVLLMGIGGKPSVLQKLRGHDDEIQCLRWCPEPGEDIRQRTDDDPDDLDPVPQEHKDGYLLVSSSKDKTIRMWSTSKGKGLLTLKVPTSSWQSREDKSRVWITLTWPKQTPRKLISSSVSGDVLLWDICHPGKQKWQSMNTGPYKHTRLVFNLCTGGSDLKTLFSISMDRQVIIWNWEQQTSLYLLPTIGGYVYSMQCSPVNPGYLAIGAGDNMIHIWNTGNPSNKLDMTSYWQGVKANVTSICWHPVREGILAYGTKTGRVGVYNLLSNKQPEISNTYHQNSVRIVTWGPSCSLDGTCINKDEYVLNSVGDGVIYQHHLKHLDQDAVNLNKIIQKTNGLTRQAGHTYIQWKPDLSIVAVGNADGTVEIYVPPRLYLCAIIQVERQSITCLSWHPAFTVTSPNGSRLHSWLAITSFNSLVRVVDLSGIVAKELGAGDSTPVVTSSKNIDVHSNAVMDICWNPHKDGVVVSVSYDGSAQVWDVCQMSPIASYHGHSDFLLAVCWSAVDEDVIYTGGYDFMVLQWNVSKQEFRRAARNTTFGNPNKSSRGKSKKNKGKKPALPAAVKTEVVEVQSGKDTVGLPTVDSQTHDSGDEYEQLALEISKQTGSVPGALKYIQDSGDTISLEPVLSLPRAEPRSKKKREKSFLPLTSTLENQGKASHIEDCQYIADIIIVKDGNKRAGVGEYLHLATFCDQQGVDRLLNAEGHYQLHQGHIEQYISLEVWRGNLSAVTKMAAESGLINDWLIILNAYSTLPSYVDLCDNYVTQLEEAGNVHKAATFLVANNDIITAINILRNNLHFREAVILAKIHLPEDDPICQAVLWAWADYLIAQNAYELAAKCFLALEEYAEAATWLARRGDLSGVKVAVHICSLSGQDKTCIEYLYRLVTDSLLKLDWSPGFLILDQYDKSEGSSGLHYLVTTYEWISIHLEKLGIIKLEDNQKPSDDRQSTSDLYIPEFLLDPTITDGITPWPVYTIESTSFLHSLLRYWLKHYGSQHNYSEIYTRMSQYGVSQQTLHPDYKQCLYQISYNVTLCLLCALSWKSEKMVTHLLDTFTMCYNSGHQHLLKGLCQLLLPNGPTYHHKFLQEVVALQLSLTSDISKLPLGTKTKQDDCVEHSIRGFYYFAALYDMISDATVGKIMEKETAKEDDGYVKLSLDLKDIEAGYVKLSEGVRTKKLANVVKPVNLQRVLELVKHLLCIAYHYRDDIPKLVNGKSENTYLVMAPSNDVYIELNKKGASSSDQQSDGETSSSMDGKLEATLQDRETRHDVICPFAPLMKTLEDTNRPMLLTKLKELQFPEPIKTSKMVDDLAKLTLNSDDYDNVHEELKLYLS